MERPTYTKILEHALALLNEVGYDRFSVQRLIDSVGVSRTTLYRHFTDVDGLIEAALAAQYRQEADRQLQTAVDLVQQASNQKGFRTGLRTLLQGFSTIPSTVRTRRAHAIALSATRPELAAALALAQEELTDGWDAVMREAQRRGFARKDIDARTIAVMLQSLALGRIVDDVADTHLGNERWAEAFYDLIERSYLVPIS